MHSRETVVYICENFVVNGKKLFWKQEILTTDSYQNLDSLYWSRRKPISRRTFFKAQRAGYRCETITITRPPARVLSLADIKPCRKRERKKATRRNTKDARSALTRFLSR